MAYKLLITSILVVISVSTSIQGQEKYKVSTYPDVWYNDVDGIRLGVRFLGEMEGTFKDGPHRLDAGFWFGSKLPDQPVSYYLSFTEPISIISDINNEGSIQALSSSRTGFVFHRIQLNKRWQKGFDELNFLSTSIYISQEKMFDSNYREFIRLWNNEWYTLLGTNIYYTKHSDRNRFAAQLDAMYDINPHNPVFSKIDVELKNRYNLSETFQLRIRGFFGITTDRTPDSFKYQLSLPSAYDRLHSGISRAKGTIPSNWINNGSITFGGGSGLRGYLLKDLDGINDSGITPYSSILSVNIDLDYRNPMDQWLDDITIVGDFIDFRSYLFFDGARTEILDPTNGPSGNRLANAENLFDAGTGFQFSINIPDYLGNDRGIFVRYDIPFWVSNPSVTENEFEYRDILVIGALFNF